MKFWTTAGILAIAIIGTAIISINFVNYAPEIFTVYAGGTLNPDDVGKSMIVRINESGQKNEYTFDSFSHIGFSRGSENFRLESLPSVDKEIFYELVNESLSDVNGFVNPTLIDVHIDLYTGNGKKIYTFEYLKCQVKDYYLYGSDSKGKQRLIEEDDDKKSLIEFREITKFSCANFGIILD